MNIYLKKKIYNERRNEMKSLKNKKTLVFILAVFMMAAFCLTACTKDTNTEVKNEPKENSQNETNKFEKDEALDKFINPDMQNDVLEAPIGAVAPKLVFANDKYAGVLNYNGLLIYSLGDKKLSSAIDINGLGFDQIQGDGAIEITSNDEYLVLNKMGKTDGYVYSLEGKYLSKADDISKISASKAEYLGNDGINEIKAKIDEKDKDIDAIMTQNGYVVLTLDYDNLKDSKLSKLDKNYELVNSFNLSE